MGPPLRSITSVSRRAAESALRAGREPGAWSPATAGRRPPPSAPVAPSKGHRLTAGYSAQPLQHRAKRHPNGRGADPAAARASDGNASHRSANPRKRRRENPGAARTGTSRDPTQNAPQEDGYPVHRKSDSPTWDNSCSQISHSLSADSVTFHSRPVLGDCRDHPTTRPCCEWCPMVPGPPKTLGCKLLQYHHGVNNRYQPRLLLPCL
jgi:hypothetical protein